jgi:hypothetical protein
LGELAASNLKSALCWLTKAPPRPKKDIVSTYGLFGAGWVISSSDDNSQPFFLNISRARTPPGGATAFWAARPATSAGTHRNISNIIWLEQAADLVGMVGEKRRKLKCPKKYHVASGASTDAG